jgi:hypothetical protein
MNALGMVVAGSLALALIGAPAAHARVDPGTAAGLWLFDEDGGDVAGDLSGNGNHGAIDNAEWDEGVVGSALSFNGTDARVVVPDADSLDLEEAWTITAWIYVNKSDVNYGHILGKRDDGASEANYAFRTSADGTGWESYFWRGGWQGIWGAGDVIKDTWLYMTSVYDGEATVTIYENGIAIGSSNIGPPPPAGTAEVHIAGWQANSSELLDGFLDEVAIFSVALEEDDIMELMDSGIQESLGLLPVHALGKTPLAWGAIKRGLR